MSGIKIYNTGLNGIRLSKGMSVEEFKSWIVSTLGGSGNDFYESVTETTDGGYVAVGYQQSQSQGNNDALIVKYDSNLNVITQKGLGGSSHDYYQSVTETTDGGYVAVGFQNSQGQGSYDALIVKYDSNLNLVTQKGLGGSSSDYYQSVIQSSDGGYVAVGYQNSQGQGSVDALIVKYDSNLNVIKQAGLGGSGSDSYQSVVQSNDGGYVAVGYQISQGQGSIDALIVKYDSNLNVVKQAGLGGTGDDRYHSVIQTTDGGYVAVGYQGSQGQGGYDALITKLPSDLSTVDGVITNHSGLVWTTPTLIETTPTLIETTPTLTVTTPMLTVTTPTLTATSLTLVETRSEKQ